MELEKTLNDALSANQDLRNNAEKRINMFVNQNYGVFLETVGPMMFDQNLPHGVRFMSSVIIKNTFHSRNRRMQDGFAYKWLNDLTPEKRKMFVELLENNLGISEKSILNGITTILGSIIRIEYERGAAAVNYFLQLRQRVSRDENVLGNLKTLSVACNQLYDETDYSFSKNDVVLDIYGACIEYLDTTRNREDELRIEVLNAVYNCLDIFSGVFEDQGQASDFLSRLGTFAACGGDVLEETLEVINKFVEQCHRHIGGNMLGTIAKYYDSLFDSDDDNIVVLVIEFWEQLIELREYDNLVRERLNALLGLLYGQLVREDPSDMDYSAHKAACNVLSALAERFGAVVMNASVSRSFITEKLHASTGADKAVGALALGHVYRLQKPKEHNNRINVLDADANNINTETSTIYGDISNINNTNNSIYEANLIDHREFIQPIISLLINGINSTDSNADEYLHEFLFCISNICSRDLESTTEYLQAIFERCGYLILYGSSALATSAAWAYSLIFTHFREIIENGIDNGFSNGFKNHSDFDQTCTRILYRNYLDIVTLLINKLDTMDLDDFTLRNAVISALSELVLCYSPELTPIFNDLLVYLVNKISQVVATPLNSQTVFTVDDILSHYTVIITLVAEKIPISPEFPSGTLAAAFTAILKLPDNKSHGEVYIAISKLVHKLSNYIITLLPYILNGLRSQDSFVLKSALNLISDTTILNIVNLADSFDTKDNKSTLSNTGDSYLDKNNTPLHAVVSSFVTAISSPELPIDCKPMIIDSFADVALASGNRFVLYIDMCLVLFDQIIVLKRAGDEDYVDSLRKSAMKLFSYIIISVGYERELQTRINRIIELVRKAIFIDIDCAHVQESVDIILDTKNIFGLSYIAFPWVVNFLENAISNKKPHLSTKLIGKVRNLINEIKC